MTSPAPGIVPGTTPRAWPPPSQPVEQTSVVAPDIAAYDDVRVADFSYQPRPVRFTIDGEVYDCYPIISPAIAQDITALAKNGIGDVSASSGDVTEMMTGISAIFRVVMKPQSAERFIERLHSRDEPLDINRQVIPVIHWLLEQYGVRPTPPSSGSSDGSREETGGTSSTHGVSSRESILPT